MKVQLLGERCSGTNFLQKMLEYNFDIECVWSAGWKHWPLPHLVEGDVIYIYIHRNIHDWSASNIKHRHHVPSDVKDILRTKWTIQAEHVPNNIPRTLLEQREVFLETIFAMQGSIHYWVDYDWLCQNQVRWMSALRLPRKGPIKPYGFKVGPGGHVTNMSWKPIKYRKITLPYNESYENWADHMITRNLEALHLLET